MPIKGVDVSHFQASIDWPSLAQAGDIQFALAKASEGTTLADSNFVENWTAIRSAGIVRGAYHFARPSNNAAADEADWFLSQVSSAGGLSAGDLLALDLEDINAVADLHDWALGWLQRVEGVVGFRPFIYSGGPYIRSHGLGGEDDLAGYPLWYSRYTYQFDSIPAAPANWSSVVIHQYSDQGKVDGISGLVDLDCFAADTLDELRGYGAPRSKAASRYTVQPGDTWEAIANLFAVSVSDLKSANPNIDRLDPGLLLMIPQTAVA